MPTKRLEFLRGLIAAVAEQGGELMSVDEILAAEMPSSQPLARLRTVQVALRGLAERMSAVEPSDDSNAILEDISSATQAIDAELARRPDPAAVAASLLASIRAPGDDGSEVPTSVRRPRLGEVRAPSDPRRSHRPGGGAGDQVRATLVAAGSRDELDSLGALTQAMHLAGSTMKTSGDRGRPVASLEWEYPQERRLGKDPAANARVLEQVAGPQAIAASGGICGPVAVDYSVPTFATQERPLRDGLVQFGADRGGVMFTSPPTLTELAAATSVWTEAIDAAPGETVKTTAAVSCPDLQTVYVDAVPTRILMGNFLQRFNPEVATAQVETALAYAARVAELNLLAKINAASTETTSTAYLGATRDLLATIDLVCAAIRERQRVPRSTMMRVVLSDWVRDMLRADLARELAHDRDGENNLSVTDAQIDAYLAVRGIVPIWILDPLAAQGTGRTYPLQGFADQAAGALNGWPTKVVFYVFPEGSFTFLDGGLLNLGVIRDSTLNATNDLEMMVEPFESVAFRGIESLKVIAPLAPNGGSAGSVATSTYTAGI